MSISADLPPGPLLPEEKESPSTLFAIAAAAFLAQWVVTPALYQIISGRALFPASQSTTQALSQIDPRDLVALSVAAPIVGMVTLVIANLLWRKRAFERLGFTLAHLRRSGWKFGLISAAIVLPAAFGVNLLTEKIWNSIHFAHPTEHDLLKIMGDDSSRFVRIAIIVSATILAPVFEEFFFRGMLQSACRMIMPAWAAIMISSIAFAAVHPLWMAPPIFFLAVCLGYVYSRTTNLWVPIIVHAAFNSLSVALFLLIR